MLRVIRVNLQIFNATICRNRVFKFLIFLEFLISYESVPFFEPLWFSFDTYYQFFWNFLLIPTYNFKEIFNITFWQLGNWWTAPPCTKYDEGWFIKFFPYKLHENLDFSPVWCADSEYEIISIPLKKSIYEKITKNFEDFLMEPLEAFLKNKI